MVHKVLQSSQANVPTLYEVIQCPPNDNLYVAICADGAFSLKYRIRVIDTLEREMLIAYNLDMNMDGTFSKKRKSGTRHAVSSYAVAKSAIEKFYKNLPQL